MSVLLGLIAAAFWGTGDFAGGFAARRAHESAVVLGTEAVGLVLLLAIAPFVAGSPTGADLGIGGLAGVAGVTGLALLYRGLARGRASVVAPISAVGAALLQVGWGLARGERPGWVALAGISLALVSIGIVAGSADDPPARVGEPDPGRDTAAESDQPPLDRRAEIQCGLGAAVGFGLYLILISETSDDAGLWTAVAARAAPLILLVLALGLLRRPMRPSRAAWPFVGIAGITDAGANALLLTAVRLGDLSVVAAVANLYPAITVLLARAFGHERITPMRLAGLGLAVISLGLISVPH